MDHHLGVNASGSVEGYDDEYYFGRRANGFYIPRFRNTMNDKRDYLRSFGYQGSASRQGWSREIAELQLGGDFKDALSEPSGWGVFMMMQGETIPKESNHLRLSKDQKDEWGIPQLITSVSYDDNDEKLLKDFLQQGEEMLTKAGCKNIQTDESSPPESIDPTPPALRSRQRTACVNTVRKASA